MSGIPQRAATLTTLLLGLVLVLGGCGDRPSATTAPGPVVAGSPTPVAATPTPSAVPTPTPTPTPASAYPACARVWRTGARVPAAYRACTSGDVVVRDRRRSCSSGQVLILHAARWYGVLRGPVNRVRGPHPAHQLRQVVRTCVG